MGPAEAASSPVFSILDPVVVDDDMEAVYQDTNLDFLDSGLPGTAESAGRDFDDLFAHSTSSRTVTDSESTCLSPAELSVKRPYSDADVLKQPRIVKSDSPAESPDDSSRSSSSESPRNHIRNSSLASSAVYSENSNMPFGYTTEDWINPDLMPVKEEEDSFSFDPSMSLIDGQFGTEPDLTENVMMNSAFDFESAASSPSPLKTDPPPQPTTQRNSRSHLRSPSNLTARQASSPNFSTGSSYFNLGAKEPSPFSASRFPVKGKSPSNQWGGQSPSSLLEESFGGINMNGSSPLNQGLNFPSNAFTFGLNLAPSPAPNTVRPECPQRHVLTVHPTSLKSRVETQIPIRLTLFPLPTGVKKIRLPSHTISKPKFLAPASAEKSAEVVELHTSLVCTSAMQDQTKLKKAYARARGDNHYRASSSSPQTLSDLPEDEKPLDGGEVKICTGCIQRERKRAFRKKQRKPEEDQLFQKDEEKRVIVFNTNEIKEWTEPSKSTMPGKGDTPGPIIPAGAMQVELPMRIACYCRHQNEKLGFQVIFTVKDYRDNVIAQAITNSIMITDDHKTHAPSAAPAPGPSPALPDGTQLPGVGVFPSGPSVDQGKTPKQAKSPSATDLQGLQQRFNSQYQANGGSCSLSQNQTNGVGPSNSQTPRSLSRQTSPNDFQGPMSKRRKHSNSGRLPSELTMTKLEGVQSSSSVSSASGLGNDSQFSAPRGFTSPVERPFVTASGMSNQFGNGPPTPGSGENNPFFNPNAQQSLDSFIQQQLMSAPNSAQPSRPGTPGGSRNTFQDHGLNPLLGPSPATPIWPHITNAGNRLPSVIHKLVPAEGSITGGTEVTLLGSGFYPGMEVVFGDTLATTTTFWGDKCLNCLTPPSLQPGIVAVVFKHEHPTFGQLQTAPPLMPKQQQYFRYVDDRELQMYRLALGILGQKLGSQADAFQTAQQIMGSDTKSMFNLPKDFQGSSGGHQRQVPGMESQGKLSDLDSKMLTYLEFIDLDDNPRPPKFNSRGGTGQTLLHFASSLGLTRFVAGLLARGANPDLQDSTGNTPMHLAALNGHAHIVHRLRLAGANVHARSVRGFTPADLATTLPAHQAALIPARHYRSRSVGSLASSRRRHSSSASLHSMWESSSSSFDNAVDDSEDEEETEEEGDDDAGLTMSRRASVHQDAPPTTPPPEQSGPEQDARPFSPPAALVAWRNQLQAQINQFQQSVANAFPNLPALPPMPALPDYQAHPMMRRITNLVPHRPTTAKSVKDGWWDMLTGNSAPSTTELPSYEDLYPHKEQDEEEAERVKKSSMLQAATEAALDQHFEAQANVQASSSQTPTASKDKDDLKDIRIGRKVISREQQKHLREQQAQRMKGLGNDRNLYFIWIPLLVLVIGAWIRSYLPGIWQGFSSGYEFVKSRYAQRALDLGT